MFCYGYGIVCVKWWCGYVSVSYVFCDKYIKMLVFLLIFIEKVGE